MFVPNKCDPYVRILIQDQEVFRTTTKEEDNQPKFHERFQTEKIFKKSKIEIQIMDDDTGYSEDDLMSRCTVDIDQLVNGFDFICDGTSITITSKWTDA